MPHAKPHAHRFPIRIYYEDTDAGGVVYNANFLKFAERARTEYLRELGHNQSDITAEYKIYWVVRHAEIDYRAPAKLDDLLDISTDIVNIGNTSMTIGHVIRRAETVLAEIKIVLVFVNLAGKAVRIPPHLRQIFEG